MHLDIDASLGMHVASNKGLLPATGNASNTLSECYQALSSRRAVHV
jgi:hypothetical protein